MDDERIVISSSAAISPEAVAGKGFTTVLRGYQPAEVRQFLKRVADEVAAAQEREGELRRALHDAQNRAAHPELDEAALTSSLGEHAGRLIASARETAAAITAEAERTAAATLRDAEYRIARIRQEADTLMARRVDEADGVSASLRQSAEADARAVRDQAQAEAEAAIQAARSHGKEMVAEARAVRERMLGDLARRRRVAEVQLEQLRVARERLVQAYDVVRHTLEEVTAELAAAEPEARLAAEAVGRRMSDADAHPPLRMAESQLRVASAAGVGPRRPPASAPTSVGIELPAGLAAAAVRPAHRVTEFPSRPAASAFGSESLSPAHESVIVPTESAGAAIGVGAGCPGPFRTPPGPAGVDRTGGRQRGRAPLVAVAHPSAGRAGAGPRRRHRWRRHPSRARLRPRRPRHLGRSRLRQAPREAGRGPAARPSRAPRRRPRGAARPRGRRLRPAPVPRVVVRPSATPAPTGTAATPADPSAAGNPSRAGAGPGTASGPTASPVATGGAPIGQLVAGARLRRRQPARPRRPAGTGRSPPDHRCGRRRSPTACPTAAGRFPRPPSRPGGPGHPSRPLPGGSDAPGPGGPSRPPGAAGSEVAGGPRTGSSRTALDLRPTPPDLPREVPAARPDQPPELATSEQPVVRTPGEGPVDELFARLRHQAEAEPPAPTATAGPSPTPTAPPPTRWSRRPPSPSATSSSTRSTPTSPAPSSASSRTSRTACSNACGRAAGPAPRRS